MVGCDRTASRSSAAGGSCWSCITGISNLRKIGRPDIAGPVNMVAQFCKEPTVGAWKAQMRILAYLVGTTKHRLEVDRVKGTVWSSYSDSNQGGDRRFGSTTSRTGIMLCCNGMPYHWRSNKQPSTAMSSAAAEIVCLLYTSPSPRDRG